MKQAFTTSDKNKKFAEGLGLSALYQKVSQKK